MTRSTEPREIAEMKIGFAALIQGAGGLDAAATITRVGRSQLSDYANPHKPDVMPPVDVVTDLERNCGKPLVTAALARMSNHQLVPLEIAAEGDEIKACAIAFRTAAEGGAALFELAPDGKLDDRGRDVLDMHLAALVRHALAARSQFARRRQTIRRVA